MIGREYWGNGYAYEAAQAIVEYSFKVLGLHRIVAKVNPENKASKQIIENLGFQFEHVLENLPEEHEECNGELLYSLRRFHL